MDTIRIDQLIQHVIINPHFRYLIIAGIESF
jgi:hypothetical protein